MTATPRCPHCQARGLKHLAQKQIGPYLLVYCGNCGAIFGFVPNLLKTASKQAPGRRTPRQPVFEVIGQADISRKEPYSPQKIAARMRAARASMGSLYMQVAEDFGPPICPKHKVDMVREVVPAGYPNSGLTVWVCPHFKGCESWEIAEE